MPALTHGRVKNGHTGPIRKNNASVPVKTTRVQSVKTDPQRKEAKNDTIGAKSTFARNAIKRRVVQSKCDCSN